MIGTSHRLILQEKAFQKVEPYSESGNFQDNAAFAE